MATKILDRDRVLELLRKYRPSLTMVKVGGGTYNAQFTCPFHADTNPSFSFSVERNNGTCFACKKHAKLDVLISAFEQISSTEAEKLAAGYYKRVASTPAARKVQTVDVSQAQLQEWHVALGTDLRLQKLITKWGWNTTLTEKYMLGSSDGRLTIPMFEGVDLVGLKYYSPGATSMKYQNVPGSAQCCWPLENLMEDVVYLVEGEKDCLTMLAAGFNAITFTGGAGAVPSNYIRHFAGKAVYIIYDVDEAGRTGSVAVAKILNCATKKIHIVDLPITGIAKGDLTDLYMQDPEHFAEYVQELCENTDEYQAPAAVSRVMIPPEIHKTYLEDLVPKNMYYRRVNMKVRIVNNAQHETTIIPKDVELRCTRDYKDALCQGCPAFYKHEGLHLHVKPEYPELMSMVGNNVKVQRAAIQSMTGVVEGCTKFKYEQKTFQGLYPIVIIPAIEAEKKSHNYSMFTAWSLDAPTKENEDYEVEGVTLANPETQKLELICYKMTKDASSLDSFELTEDMIKQLEIFKCEAPLLEKLATS